MSNASRFNESGCRALPEYHDEVNSYRLSKRQKTSHHEYENGNSYDVYTVAWICALHIELTAARAMLDEVHRDLPRRPNDDNSYTLGNIGQHNIVIACLPDSQYGTNNAANVLTSLTRTFSSIRYGLMVGIGGGVPTNGADICLGDIVVGTRVMQYDLGRTVRGEELQRTADPKIPASSLRTAVTSLRARHEQHQSRVPVILREKMVDLLGYRHPGTPDRLFQATYKHTFPPLSCDMCDNSKLIQRKTRLSDAPVIHYGAIASGNQVMKDAMTRDQIAKELDAICFEMEAAGLMDILPCLPIRGICDYSDSHKAKEWQRYAAATAAAYAREFLEILAAENKAGKTRRKPSPEQDASDYRRKNLLDSLRFQQIDSRETAIKRADTRTCKWFLEQPEYMSWLDLKKLYEHHGFLWIRGKPGVGKSTIMKFIYQETKKDDDGDALTASFFFNARGASLEKTTSGMYRSLLLQLLEKFPNFQEVFKDPDLVPPRGKIVCPPLNVLKELFRSAISKLGNRSFTCFIDALDECDEQQVMDMVEYFEDLAEYCTDNNILLRICLSSRHYPYIDVRLGMRLTLEDQYGHTEDLENYIRSHLRVRNPILKEELRLRMLDKASGVFLWVVLVVDILNRENRRGGLAIRKKLEETPSGLSELFKGLLKRDNDNMEELLLCVLWILFAKRPLRPEEYCHALWSGLSLENLVDPDFPEVNDLDASDRLDRFVVSSSKGLAEITEPWESRVQFIHESVRDFLIKDKGLYELWPNLGLDLEALAHKRLMQCCNSYMKLAPVCRSSSLLPSVARLETFPFLEYASQYILVHTNSVADEIIQRNFLDQFSVSEWVNIINNLDKYRVGRYKPRVRPPSVHLPSVYLPGVDLLYILAEKGLSNLIRIRLEQDPCIDLGRGGYVGGRYGHPLVAAMAIASKDSVAALLNLRSSIGDDGVDITKGLEVQTYRDGTTYTPLSWAAGQGLLGIMRILLEKGVNINETDSGRMTPLERASKNDQDAAVSLLVDRGANTKASIARSSMSGVKILAQLLRSGNWAAAEFLTNMLLTFDWQSKKLAVRNILSPSLCRAYEKELFEHGVEIGPIEAAMPFLAYEKGYVALARFFVEMGVDVDNAGDRQDLFLSAVRSGNPNTIKFLVQKGVDIDRRDEEDQTPLHLASWTGIEMAIKPLVDGGADIEARTQDNKTPLHLAARKGYVAVARLLIENGANPRACTRRGETALYFSIRQGHIVVTRLLIEKGADIHACTQDGETALHFATLGGDNVTARLLIEKGADIHACTQDGESALHFAAMKGYETTAKLLIDKGADIHLCTKTGETALQFATLGGNNVTSRLLIEKGAAIHA